MITSHEADKTGASVSPGEKHHSGVAVDDKVRSAQNGTEQVWHEGKVTAVGSELMEQTC